MTTLNYKSSRKAFTQANWQALWQRITNVLTASQELQVWQDHDRSGQVLWYAHDPITDRSFSGSEAELRSWIESRYYCYS
jgi:hypothetical protein